MSVQNQKPTWASEFKIDDPTWDSLLRDSITQNSTPLALAFERGLVSELLYIKQQQKVFDISALNGDFFNTPPPTGCFDGYDYNTCKKEGIIPIAQWDNQTLFAKIHGEKTVFEETIINGIFLLAPWSAMKKWFMTWEKSKSILDSPQGLNIKTNVAADALSNISFGNIKIDQQESAPKIIQENEKTNTLTNTTNDALANISFGNIKIDPSPINQENEKTNTVDSLANISFANITITPQESVSLANAENEKTQVPAMDIKPVLQNPPPLPVVAFPVAAKVPVPSHPSLPPLPNVSTPITAYPNIPLPDLNNVMSPPEITSITAITSLSSMSGAVGSIPALPIEQVAGRAQFVQNYDDLCTVVFGCWKNYFDKSVILKYENSKLISGRWDGEWATPDFRKTLEVDVSRPSIFKVVLNSEHPYHGYVVSNDINKKFFDECNKGQIPDFVNICPLIVNKTVVGMILGVCGILKSKKLSLNQLEGHAQLFSEQLLRFTSTSTKAS